MSASRDDYSKFAAADTEIVGISLNVGFSQKAFADFLQLNFPLLSDFPDGKTATYGVFNAERKLALPGGLVVDKQGVIRFKRVLAPQEPLVENDELLAAVASIK